MAASTTYSVPARGSVVALLGVLGALAVGGCGGSDDDANAQRAGDETSVRRVLSDLQAAAVAGDGKQICAEIFTPKLATSVTTSATSGSCAKEVRRNLFSPTTKLTVQTVTVADAANATAKVKEASGKASTVYLVRQSGRWRIRSIQAT
jgi:hypothetical protein